MSGWTHRICEGCYAERALLEGKGYRLPARVRDASIQQCCWCLAPTYSGIYVRHDPKDAPCKGEQGDVHDKPSQAETFLRNAYEQAMKATEPEG
jgi:hypothetical protein